MCCLDDYLGEVGIDMGTELNRSDKHKSINIRQRCPYCDNILIITWYNILLMLLPSFYTFIYFLLSENKAKF